MSAEHRLSEQGEPSNSQEPEAAETGASEEESEMLQNTERVDQFTAEIAEMHLPDTASSRDRTLLRASIVLMVVGVIVAIGAYPISHGTTNALQQRDAIVIAIIGLTVAMVGCALFLRYSFAQFLRFWMARLAWEQTAAGDRLAERLRDRN